MNNQFINSIQKTVKHWYIPLLVGLLFIVLSIVVMTSPESSLLSLSIFFSLTFLFSGLSEIIFSITNRDQLDNWGWSMAFGLLTFIVGILLLSQPGVSLQVLAFYIGFLILFRSMASISFALDIKKYGNKNWGGLMIFGLLGAIASFILILNPVFAGMSIVVLVALSLLFAGLFSIFLSFQLRKLHKSSKTISAKLQHRYDELMEDIHEEWND